MSPRATGGRDLGLVGLQLVGRGLGVAREMAVAAVFGAGPATDAYHVALRVPNLLREALVEGTLPNALVPALARAEAEGGTTRARATVDSAAGWLLVVLATVTAGLFVGAPLLVDATSGWTDPAARQHATTLARWASPMLAGLSAAQLAATVLTARDRLLAPAASALALNGAVLAGAVAAPGLETRTGIPALTTLAVATAASGFVQLALLVPALRRLGAWPRPRLRADPHLGDALRAARPALLGVAAVQGTLLLETRWAAAAGPGVLTQLTMAFRLVQLPLSVVAGSAAMLALSGVSRARAQGDTDALRAQVTRALVLNAAGAAACAVGLGILSEPLCRLLFQRGAFDAAAAAGTATLLRGYAWATVFICLHRVLGPTLHALGRPGAVAGAAGAALALKLPLLVALDRWAGLGAAAIPASHALTAAGECAVLLWVARDALELSALGRDHLRAGLAAGALGVVAWGLRDHAHVGIVVGASGATWAAVMGATGLAADLRGAPPPGGGREGDAPPPHADDGR